jgi:hypothetical protein
VIEIGSEALCGLAVAGGAVPRQRSPGRGLRQKLEKCVRIGRAVGRIVSGMP